MRNSLEGLCQAMTDFFLERDEDWFVRQEKANELFLDALSSSLLKTGNGLFEPSRDPRIDVVVTRSPFADLHLGIFS